MESAFQLLMFTDTLGPTSLSIKVFLATDPRPSVPYLHCLWPRAPSLKSYSWRMSGSHTVRQAHFE